jgi:hypothetical protein
MRFRPTASRPRLASKVVRAGATEAVLWHRRLLVQGRRLSAQDVARDLSGLPRRLVAGRSRGRAALARDVATTLGHAYGWARWVRPGRLDAPRYVGDDPMGPTVPDGEAGPQR